MATTEEFVKMAKAKGLSKEEVRQALILRNQANGKTPPPQDGFLKSVGKSMIKPFAKTGRDALLAGGSLLSPLLRAVTNNETNQTVQGGQQLAQLNQQIREGQARGEDVSQLQAQAQQLAQQQRGQYDMRSKGQSVGDFNQNMTEGILDSRQKNNLMTGKDLALEGIKNASGVMAYAVPMGKGANILTKATLPSALAGGLSALGQSDQTDVGQLAKEAGVGSLIGGVTGTALYGAKKGIQSLIKNKKSNSMDVIKEINKQMEKESGRAVLPSDQGARDIATMNPVQKKGNELVGSQIEAVAKVTRNTNAPEAVRKMTDYGFANIDDWQPVSKAVNKVLGDVRDEAIGSAGRVNTTGFMKEQLPQLLEEATDLSPAEKKVVTQYFKNMLSRASGGAKGSLSPTQGAKEMFKAIQELGGKGSQYVTGIVPTVADKQKANIYFTAQKILEDKVYGSAGANADAMLKKAFTPAVEQQLQQISPSLAKDARYIVENYGIKEFRSLLKPFVDAGRLAENTAQTNSMAWYGGAKDASRGLGKLIKFDLLKGIASSKAVNRSAGQVIRKAGDVGEKISQSQLVKLLSALKNATGKGISKAGDSKLLQGLSQPTIQAFRKYLE